MSIRHLELADVLVTVFEGEGDEVVARMGDVEVHAVGRVDGGGVHGVAGVGGEVDVNLA